jgi:hypothetical protein
MCCTASQSEMAVLLQVLDMAGKLAWTGKLTAKAGNPAPNLWLDSPKKVQWTVRQCAAYRMHVWLNVHC